MFALYFLAVLAGMVTAGSGWLLLQSVLQRYSHVCLLSARGGYPRIRDLDPANEDPAPDHVQQRIGVDGSWPPQRG
jgi:hypothetical protein